jgi:hypothetical protein
MQLIQLQKVVKEDSVEEEEEVSVPEVEIEEAEVEEVEDQEDSEEEEVKMNGLHLLNLVDLLRWESINVGGYSSQRTTKAYRHGRCYMCSKPVSTTNLDPELELFCQRCGEDLTKLDCGFDGNNNSKRGMERRDRDDEEEWGRIPIPQSDDESEGDTWLGESDDSETERDIRPGSMRGQRGDRVQQRT